MTRIIRMQMCGIKRLVKNLLGFGWPIWHETDLGATTVYALNPADFHEDLSTDEHWTMAEELQSMLEILCKDYNFTLEFV